MANTYEHVLQEIQGPSPEERERRRELIKQDDLKQKENENV